VVSTGGTRGPLTPALLTRTSSDPDDGGATPWRSHRKTIDHPSLGRPTLDCETPHAPDADQAVIVYSAEAGTPEADALALLRVVGTQDMQPQRSG